MVKPALPVMGAAIVGLTPLARLIFAPPTSVSVLTPLAATV
jgi:hypothetical protein